jgi:ADP-heptose:LPS heptosyltransferase
MNMLKTNRKTIPLGLKEAGDYSIRLKFNDYILGHTEYTDSSFLKHTLCDVSKFVLPENYALICPYSNDKRIIGRDFDEQDWSGCTAILKRLGLDGVVINDNDEFVPEGLTNLSCQTSILESVEILKKSKAYIGVDSCLSVLAAKLFKQPNLLIKCKNQQCYDNAMCYFAPHNEFSFMKERISDEL